MARGGGGWDAPIYRKNRKIKDLTPDPLDHNLSSVVYYRYYGIIAVFDNILNFDINRL